MDSSTVGESLIEDNFLGRLIATEVFLEELLSLGNTSRATNKNILKRTELIWKLDIRPYSEN